MLLVGRESVVAAPAVVSEGIWESYATPIECGFCHTDLDTSRFYTTPLNNVDDYGEIVESHLAEMGIPFQTKDFLGGTNYDLLFFENHGMVLKVGLGHDPIDHIHPCLSQPLGWITDEKTGLNTSLYAGEAIDPEEWHSNMPNNHLVKILDASGQGSGDAVPDNLSFLIVNGQRLPILIDVDKDDNKTTDKSIAKRKQKLKRRLWDREGVNNAESHKGILFEVYSGNKKLEPWMAQFDRHQPLRQLYWDAMKQPLARRSAALKVFWDTAAEWTKFPQANGIQLRRDYLRCPA